MPLALYSTQCAHAFPGTVGVSSGATVTHRTLCKPLKCVFWKLPVSVQWKCQSSNQWHILPDRRGEQPRPNVKHVPQCEPSADSSSRLRSRLCSERACRSRRFPRACLVTDFPLLPQGRESRALARGSINMFLELVFLSFKTHGKPMCWSVLPFIYIFVEFFYFFLTLMFYKSAV